MTKCQAGEGVSCRLSHVRFFFFQAEDGIRDYKVTGVQTCALPISHAGRASARLRAPVAATHSALARRKPLFLVGGGKNRAECSGCNTVSSAVASDRKSVV